MDRSEQAQADLMTIRIRAALVEARTSLVNAARGFAKAQGRLPACASGNGATQFGAEMAAPLRTPTGTGANRSIKGANGSRASRRGKQEPFLEGKGEGEPQATIEDKVEKERC